MNKKQWVVLIIGLLLVSLIVSTLIGSSYVFTTVNGKPRTIYDSTYIPEGIKWLALVGFSTLTVTCLFLLRSSKRAVGQPNMDGPPEGEWPHRQTRPTTVNERGNDEEG